jgi:fatty acid desaturase
VDLEIAAPRPVKLWKILSELLYLTSGVFFIRLLVLHSLGIPAKAARRVVPKSDFPRMFWAARAVLGLHLAAIALAIVIHSWLPILLFTVPRFYGAGLLFIFALTQHAGLAENSNDHRLVARTVKLNPVFSFLYMHMQYHVEHHIFPMVPFHALGKLHKAVRDQMPVPYRGLWGAYKEIVPTLLRQRYDVNFYVKRDPSLTNLL